MRNRPCPSVGAEEEETLDAVSALAADRPRLERMSAAARRMARRGAARRAAELLEQLTKNKV